MGSQLCQRGIILELNSSNNINPNIDFQKTVNEAKNAIQNEEQKKVRKSRSDKGRVRKAEGGNNVSPNSAFGPTATAQNPSSPIGSPQVATVDFSPYLAVPIEMISRGPARKHKIPELALTQQEALDCAKAINEVFNVFVPNINQMSPKAGAIVGAAIVIGSVALSKYQIFTEVSAIRQSQLSEAPPINKEAPQSPSEIPIPKDGILAQNYFGR